MYMYMHVGEFYMHITCLPICQLDGYRYVYALTIVEKLTQFCSLHVSTISIPILSVLPTYTRRFW